MEKQKQIFRMAQKAKKASLQMPFVSTRSKKQALRLMAKFLSDNKFYLIRENKKDLLVARRQRYSNALLDRLTLTDKRIREMADSLVATAKLKDPVGDVLSILRRPNGLFIKKVRVPIGVVGIIYESRPNVTSDCIGLCLMSGNATILKGGKEAFHSNKAIFTILRRALEKTKIPLEVIQLISSTDRKAVKILLSLDQYVDLVIPRGGEGLIHFVAENSRIPVVKHYKGICHIYVSDKADLEMAHEICLNAKVQRPGVCNAMETLLVHHKIAKVFLPRMIESFKRAHVEVRGCPKTKKIVRGIKTATQRDWMTEYLDLILSIKVVENLQEAVDHINTFGSHHSDAIITKNKQQADQFLTSVDSACVYRNASTRFTDGYQFGLGAEVGISTDKIHARGPMALEELTTYKFVILGKGQTRP